MYIISQEKLNMENILFPIQTQILSIYRYTSFENNICLPGLCMKIFKDSVKAESLKGNEALEKN